MKTHSRYDVARKILIFWCLFIGLGAVAGSAAMLIAPDGSILQMQELLPYFQVLPLADILYQDYVFPGIALLCINGIPNLIAAGLLLAKKKSGVICGTIFGLTLMAWIVIQFVIFPSNFLSNIYFDFGVLQAITGFAAWVFLKQEQFSVKREDYPNIGTNPQRLVVYFSRMGYTKKAAFEEADRTGAVLYEVKSTERTEGTLGFWWCGRFGMHQWDMPIEPIDVDLTAYEHVTIASPIWVFHLAAPMRSFLKAAADQVKQASYIVTHFNPCAYKSVVNEMDDLLHIKATAAESICVQWGQAKKHYSVRNAADSQAQAQTKAQG